MGPGWIPGQGPKIPQDSWRRKKKIHVKFQGIANSQNNCTRTWVCRDLEQKEMRGALFPGLGAERPQPLRRGAILLGQALPLEVESSFPASLAL